MKPEQSLHYAVVALLDQFAAPGVLYWHTNNTVSSVRYAAKLKKLGVKPGVADLIILSPARKMPCFLELKAPKGKLSEAQTAFALDVKLLGCRYEIARSLDEAAEYLEAFGALEPGRVNVRRRAA